MKIIPSRTTRLLNFPVNCFVWTLQLLVTILAFPPVSGLTALIVLVLVVKYSAYLPDNPNYRRNYDAILVEPRNPLTEKPSTIRQSDLERWERSHENGEKKASAISR